MGRRKKILVTGETVILEGTSSNDKGLNPIGERDTRLFRKLTYKWWQHILNIEPLFRGVRKSYLELRCHFILTKNIKMKIRI